MFSTLRINSFPHPDGARVPEEITMVSNITLSPYQFKTLTPLRLKYMGAIANLDIAASQKTYHNALPHAATAFLFIYFFNQQCTGQTKCYLLGMKSKIQHDTPEGFTYHIYCTVQKF